MSIVILGSTSGSITLQEPAVAGSTVLSLPATTGTVLTSASPSSDLPSSINGPAFSAYLGSGQALTLNVNTKLQFNTEEFDTNSNYDSSTNYRFTPTVAGYYQVNGCVQFGSATDGYMILYKNNAAFKYGNLAASRSAYIAIISTLVYLNGTTDYLEMYCLTTSSNTTSSGSGLTYFQASMMRAA